MENWTSYEQYSFWVNVAIATGTIGAVVFAIVQTALATRRAKSAEAEAKMREAEANARAVAAEAKANTRAEAAEAREQAALDREERHRQELLLRETQAEIHSRAQDAQVAQIQVKAIWQKLEETTRPVRLELKNGSDHEIRDVDVFALPPMARGWDMITNSAFERSLTGVPHTVPAGSTVVTATMAVRNDGGLFADELEGALAPVEMYFTDFNGVRWRVGGGEPPQLVSRPDIEHSRLTLTATWRDEPVAHEPRESDHWTRSRRR